MNKINAVEIEKYLAGIDFPADKNALVQKAKQNNAPGEVIEVLNKIPERSYRKPTDVAHEVGKMMDDSKEDTEEDDSE